MIIYTFDLVKQRKVKVGEIKGNIFIKKVNRKKHYLWKVKGYAIQAESINLLNKMGVITIKIIENKIYTYNISMAEFKANCLMWNTGHGKQYAIPEKYLTEEK